MTIWQEVRKGIADALHAYAEAIYDLGDCVYSVGSRFWRIANKVRPDER